MHDGQAARTMNLRQVVGNNGKQKYFVSGTDELKGWRFAALDSRGRAKWGLYQSTVPGGFGYSIVFGPARTLALYE